MGYIVESDMYRHNFDFEATVYDASDFFALGVRKGCGNGIVITPVFSAKEGTGSSYIMLSTGKFDYDTALDAITLAYLTENLDPDKHLEPTSISENIVFNADGNIVSQRDNGHVYVENTANSKHGEACNVVYWYNYVCSKCQDVYVDYYSYNHSFYDKTYTKIGDDEFSVTAKCDKDNGCTATSNIGKFTVDAADLSYFGTALGTSKGAVYKVVADADISYIISATGDDYAYFNVSVYYAENGTTNYKYKTGDSFAGSYDNYSGYKAEVNLGEGYDYYIIIVAGSIEGTYSDVTIENN